MSNLQPYRTKEIAIFTPITEPKRGLIKVHRHDYPGLIKRLFKGVKVRDYWRCNCNALFKFTEDSKWELSNLINLTSHFNCYIKAEHHKKFINEVLGKEISLGGDGSLTASLFDDAEEIINKKCRE